MASPSQDFMSGFRETPKGPDSLTQLLYSLAASLGMDPMVFAQMAQQNPEVLGKFLDQKGLPSPEAAGIQSPIVQPEATGLADSGDQTGLGKLLSIVKGLRQNLKPDVTLPTTEVTAPLQGVSGYSPQDYRASGMSGAGFTPSPSGGLAGLDPLKLSTTPSPELIGMAQNPQGGTPAGGIGALLAGLQGVVAPPAPVGQRVDTPAAPRPTGTIQGGQLAALLATLTGSGGFRPSVPMNLGQALK